MDDGSHLDVLHGRVRCGHVDHHFGTLFVAGLGHMDAVATPSGVPFDAVVRLGVVRGVEAQMSRRQGVVVPPAQGIRLGRQHHPVALARTKGPIVSNRVTPSSRARSRVARASAPSVGP